MCEPVSEWACALACALARMCVCMSVVCGCTCSCACVLFSQKAGENTFRGLGTNNKFCSGHILCPYHEARSCPPRKNKKVKRALSVAIPRGEGDKDLDGECVCACERASVPVGEKATELREGEREKRGSERE